MSCLVETQWNVSNWEMNKSCSRTYLMFEKIISVALQQNVNYQITEQVCLQLHLTKLEMKLIYSVIHREPNNDAIKQNILRTE